ncbi:MAG TPA: PepSY-associated TM helix domain-containing protein [Polyangiaceae bacterium]|nr:PepSY-associated TM helix domain-containing protein [Polyangiaceae bacterium]
MNAPVARGPRLRRGPRAQRVWPLLQRLIRRVHLYLGLFLWPFVLLFGITGLSFNHPTVGRGLQTRELAGDDVRRLTGFSPWNPGAIANEVVTKLNQDGKRLTLSEDFDPKFDGWPLFAAPSAGGKQVVILSLGDGSTTITDRPDDPNDGPRPLSDTPIPLERYSTTRLAEQPTPLLAEAPRRAKGPLRPHPKVHPELRFQVQDQAGVTWDVLYDLTTGEVRGKHAVAPRQRPLVELLEAIHTQHHFPPERDAKFTWALFADLTALTLIIWALTGLVMWVQLKRLRKSGGVVLALSITVAAVVVYGVAQDLSFAGMLGKTE